MPRRLQAYTPTKEDDWDSVSALYSMCMWITVLMWGCGFALQIFTAYKINFVYIFEINPISSLTHYQFYSFAAMLSFIIFFSLICQEIIFDVTINGDPQYKIPSIACQCIFLYVMFTPINHLYRNARWTLIKTCGQIWIAPFGLVKFRHFFFCNVLTTTNDIMYDFGDSLCFYANGCFKDTPKFDCSYTTYIIYAWSIIPYYWRMM